jgi:hypothetical protein
MGALVTPAVDILEYVNSLRWGHPHVVGAPTCLVGRQDRLRSTQRLPDWTHSKP